VVVTPFFEEPSIRETLRIPRDVRPWKEDESPFERLVGALRERAAAKGTLAVEATTRYFIPDELRKASGGGREIVPGDALVRACRMIKSHGCCGRLSPASNRAAEPGDASPCAPRESAQWLP